MNYLDMFNMLHEGEIKALRNALETRDSNPDLSKAFMELAETFAALRRMLDE